MDNIDIVAAKNHGVAVHITPGLSSEAVAELSLALAFVLTRCVSEFDLRIRTGERVTRSKFVGISLYKKAVDIVGIGNIGRSAAVKRIVTSEGCIVTFDPVTPRAAWQNIPHKPVTSLDELLGTSDEVTLHVPLTPETRCMLGQRELALMRKQAILANTSRGVDGKEV